MGMVLGITSATDEVIRAVLTDPPLIWKLFGVTEEVNKQRVSNGWFSRLFSKRTPTQDLERVDVKPIEDIDIDKSWHGIHYLLTGTAWEGDPPLNFLVAGGTEVGNIDVGYGVARAFDSRAVAQINSALAAISEEDLLSRFSPAEMSQMDIYPDIWVDDADNAREYCAEYFKDLKDFVERTTTAGYGMVISIS
jgi:hypothetical protein